MKTAYIRGIPDDVYARIVARKKNHDGSINNQLLKLIITEFAEQNEVSP